MEKKSITFEFSSDKEYRSRADIFLANQPLEKERTLILHVLPKESKANKMMHQDERSDEGCCLDKDSSHDHRYDSGKTWALRGDEAMTWNSMMIDDR
ncbi:hypothetical protein AKJ16_DCAP08793 [Drosera capensis]